MVQTPNLAIPHVQDSDQPEVEANAALDLLDEALNDTVNIVVTTDVTVTAAQYNENIEIDLTGTPAGVFDVFLPNNNRLFIVNNATGQTATVGVDDLGGGFTGTTVAIEDGNAFILYSDGTNVTQVGGGGGSALTIEDEGVSTVTDTASINFAGAGVAVTDAGGNEALVTIPGAGTGGFATSAVRHIESVTASGAAQLDCESFFGDGETYSQLIFVGEDLRADTDTSYLAIRYKLNGTYKSTTDYSIAEMANSSGDVFSGDGGVLGNFIPLLPFNDSPGSAANEWTMSNVKINAPKSSRYKIAEAVTNFVRSDSGFSTAIAGGFYDGTDATSELEGVRFMANSGNISGTVHVYGLLTENPPLPTPVYNGTVVQQVSASDDTTRSTTSLSFVTTNLSVNITPTSSANKIRLRWHSVADTSSASGGGYFTFFRDSTDLTPAGRDGIVTHVPTNASLLMPVSMEWVDSPASTSQITYSARFATNNVSFTLSINGRDSDSNFDAAGFLIAEEITPDGVAVQTVPAAVPAGPWEFLEELDLASQSSVESQAFADDSSIIAVQFRVRNVVPGTDDTDFTARFRKNATVQTGSTYDYVGWFGDSGGGAGAEEGAINDSSIILNRDTATARLGSAAGESYNAVLSLEGPHETQRHQLKFDAGYWAALGRQYQWFGQGSYDGTDATAALDGVEFSISSGTFTSGKIAVYGIRAQTSTQKQSLNLSLGELREIVSNDTDTSANHGGILTNDSTPAYARVNGATDKALRVNWVAGNVDEVQFPPTFMPPNFDANNDITIHLLARMSGATDTPTIDVQVFDGIGDTEMGGATAALSNTLTELTVTIAQADLAGNPTGFLNIALVPGTHATDAVELYAAWIEYVEKTT